MDEEIFHRLLSPAGQEILQTAVAISPKETDFLSHYQSLSRRFPPDLSRAALEIAIIRREAKNKFPFADLLYLSRQDFEQASSFEVSTYRAERFRQYSQIADLGCSIGADTFALANITSTIGVDIDRLRLAMAFANLQALGLSARVGLVQSDLTSPLPLKPGSTALFFDPARRSGDRRFFSVQQYQPPLSIIHDWLPEYPALAVKISPGVKLQELEIYDAEVEFISLHGELKESVLWFGSLKTASRRATVLPGPYQLVSMSSGYQSESSHAITTPGAFLYEPDPAVIRSGLVTNLAGILNASQIDPDIAYLTSDTYNSTPFARVWKIEDWLPFNLKRLRAYCHQHHIGHVTVKKRGSPLEPGFLIHKLHLKGDQERVLVLSHLRGEPVVLICNKV